MKLASPLDFQKNAANNMVLQPLGGDPASPVLGQLYFNSNTLQVLAYNGSGFSLKATDSALFNNQNPAYYLNRANHSGSQLAATISDLAGTVKAYTLDSFAAPTVSVSFGNQKIINLADPVNPQDAATKNYVDNTVQSAAAGIDSKPSVRLVLTANDTLSGLAARDGITPVAGDRILATAQSTATNNGVWIAASGAWTRAVDADQTGEITPGAFWYVEEGTANAASQWRCSNTGTVTLGTTNITIVQFGAAAVYTASLGVQKVGNDFRGQVVAGGGVLASSGGFQLDTTVAARKATFTGGDGSTTSVPLTHNFGTKAVSVTVQLISTGEVLLVDWVATDTTKVTLTFAQPPAANSVSVIVIG